MNFNEFMLNDICGNDMFDSILQTLSINLFDQSLNSGNTLNISNVLTVVENLHETIIKPTALMLVFLYFMIAVVDKLSSENFTWEQLWKQLAMLLAAKMLIDYGFDILSTLYQIGQTLAAQIELYLVGGDAAGNLTDSGLAVDAGEMLKKIEDSMGLKGIMKVLSNFVVMIFLLIPWALSWIMGMAVKIICYSRMIEIYIRAVFMPFAISDFFHTGLQSGGWRFLKNFLAVGIQGAMILVIAAIYSSLYESLVTEAFDSMVFSLTGLFSFVGLSLAFMASAVMLMFKSLSLSKEVLGTGG